MFHRFASSLLLVFPVLFLGLWTPAPGQQAVANPRDREAKPKLRFICISSLEEDQKAVLASLNEKGDWLELGEVELRSSYVTEWMPAGKGLLHLALRQEGTLKSICRFTYPESSRRALVVLIAEKRKKEYEAYVVDPEKLKFEKGSVLIVNFSRQDGMVVLGSTKVAVNSGQRVVARPGLDENGMYRILAAYLDGQKKPVPCFDGYFSGDPNLRKMLFLLPDPTPGFRVFSLPMFGGLE